MATEFSACKWWARGIGLRGQLHSEIWTVGEKHFSSTLSGSVIVACELTQQKINKKGGGNHCQSWFMHAMCLIPAEFNDEHV